MSRDPGIGANHPLGEIAVRSINRMLSLSAFGLLSLSAAVCAEDANLARTYIPNGPNSSIGVYVAAARVEGAAGANDLGQGVDNATLAGLSGGAEIVEQNTNLTGTMTNDSASHIYSGDNMITGSAFAGEAGVPVLIQNSGSNVLIQNATVLNVQFKP
jgi:hypothetical protein